jgi:hypothetical protein
MIVRWVSILVVVALAMSAIVVIRAIWEPVLRAAGWALVVSEPVTPVDIIVLSIDSGPAGALESADLAAKRHLKKSCSFYAPSK